MASKGGQQASGEAAQFFSGQDVESQNASLQATAEKVVDLLNQSQLTSSENKLNYLKQVQELIVNKDPTLLDNFLDEILIFQQDRSGDIRKFVVVFIEEACKKDPALLSKTVGCLSYMLSDENTTVSKRVMLACNSLYKLALQLICKVRTIKDDRREMWESMNELKRHICGMIESDNDGVRTHAIKFMEMLILVHSPRSQNEDRRRDGDISLDIVPKNHPLVKYDDLVDEGVTTLEALLALCASSNISSVNLMAVLSSLASIGKQRPMFLSTVVKSFESLHANLPQTLSKSQVSSVRKNLKLQLFSIIRLSSAEPYITQIGTLLTDLGATGPEIQKSLPKLGSQKPRTNDEDANVMSKKKIKTEDKMDVSGQFSLSKAIELTTADIVPRLTKETVTNLVLVSMLFLPRSMPSHFQETFTPIAAAGSSTQAEHLGRLMATQMTNAGVGVGVEMAKEVAATEKKEKKIGKVETSLTKQAGGEQSKTKSSSSKQPRSVRDIASDLKVGSKSSSADSSSTRVRKIKQFRLQDAVQNLKSDGRKKMLHLSYKRILRATKKASISGSSAEQHKIIVGLAMQFYEELTADLIEFVMEDFRSRIDLCILWLFQEYVKAESKGDVIMLRYTQCLESIINGMKTCLEPRDKLFTRFILEAPYLSDGVRKIIKEYCMDPERIMVGFSTLRELISKTPARCQEWLQLLLELTTAEKEQVRVQAIHSAKKLHSRPDFADSIEDFALHSLQRLLLDTPPIKETFSDENQVEVETSEWSEESIKSYLYLYLALLPTNHALFLNLAEVYVDASAIIKRTILRHLEHPVRAIGMNSPELLRLVEHCPTGAETLVTRVLHIVTDKSPPTQELVQKVKELYHKRVSDVRFLIPVLNGLAKNEIIDVLPKLISQTPNVVKEVFNRLLGSTQTNTAAANPSLSPSELLVALHSVESKSDVKAVMKAINICFGEKNIYTQEVLAVVIQQLMDISPLPTLFMRTVIQSLGMCPRLVGFVMNILSKLINKQVWKYPKVWQGFVKCCQMTKPQSFPVLLQLPPKQLESVFEIAPDVKEQLENHVENLTSNQRSHIPKTVLQLLEKEEKPSSSTNADDLSATYSSSESRKRKADVKESPRAASKRKLTESDKS